MTKSLLKTEKSWRKVSYTLDETVKVKIKQINFALSFSLKS